MVLQFYLLQRHVFCLMHLLFPESLFTVIGIIKLMMLLVVHFDCMEESELTDNQYALLHTTI